jgi:hypothetical protein
MGTFQTHPPASLRTASPSQRAGSGNPHIATEAARPYLIAGRKGRTPAVGKTAFMALPRESEDARITGSTRSLDRRLLALNLQGSKKSVKPSSKGITDILIA